MKSQDPIFVYLNSVYKNLTLFIFLTLFSFLFSYIFIFKNSDSNIVYKKLIFSNSLFQVSNLNPTFLYKIKNYSVAANDYNYLIFLRKFERDFDYSKFCKFKHNPNKKVSIKIPGESDKKDIKSLSSIKIYFNTFDEKKSEECIKKIFFVLKKKEKEIYFDIFKKVYLYDWFENQNENSNKDLITFEDKKKIKIEDFDKPFTKLAAYNAIRNFTEFKMLERLKAVEDLGINFQDDILDVIFQDIKTLNKLKLDFTPIEIFEIKTNISDQSTKHFQTFIIFFGLFNFLGIALIFINRNLKKLNFIK